MSEQNTENPTVEPEAIAPESTETENAEAPELGDAGKKAIQAERDARKAAEKAAAEYKAKLKEIEDANLSEVEKANRLAAESAAELAALRTESLRSRVALEKGVPADLVGFLTGDTEEDIAAKADLLMSRLTAPKSPKPDLSQGAKGGDKKSSTGDQFADFFTSKLSS
ncbi:hypothetical protein GCM10022377_10130 [Zhihengliuella alba]|uniref:DUF4355 domain-containing protein n=1 Tax=Zhihengliuella alba TaxID=547018 RepID=A0ABP7D0E7_9MICC